MSSVGRRQVGADQDKFDLSKKTIRDVAAELARRSQPAVLAGGQQPVTSISPAAPAVETLAPVVQPGQAPTDNPGADNPGEDLGRGEGNDQSPSNLIQMDPRPGVSQPAAVSNPLWAEHRPFADDPAGPAPLEALSRALDHKQFELPDNIALTPSSMMTTELTVPPLIATPSAAHPAISGAELPLQESVKTPLPRENKAPYQTIRHYPSPHVSLLNRLRAAWLQYSLSRTPRSASVPMRRVGMDWSTLSLGVGIGLIVGVGAIMLQPKSPSGQSPSGQPGLQQLGTPSTANPSRATPTIVAAPSPASPPSLPTTPSAVGSSAVGTSAVGTSAVQTSVLTSATTGMVPAAPHPRDMTATTFGIPAFLQPNKLAASASGAMPGSPAENSLATNNAAAAGTGSPAATVPAGTTQKPAKTVTKSKAKPAKKSSAGQHATSNATEPLSPAKR
ncbi:MAG TPA: hypothetical protein VM659_07885 [Dongiaceae bacterium]|nr:hypothetical protein [Dongiaceae bacterium]